MINNTTSEREAFEAWARQFYILDLTSDGKYEYQGAYIAWFAWQSRAAMQTAEPGELPDTIERERVAEWGKSRDAFDKWFQGEYQADRLCGLDEDTAWAGYQAGQQSIAVDGAPSTNSAADADRLRFAMQDIDGFGKLVMDKYDYAIQIAEANGRDVPSEDDELNGIRMLIDTAIATMQQSTTPTEGDAS